MLFPRALSDDAFDDFGSFDSGQFSVQTLELIREPIGVDAESIQHGSMEIVDADGIFDDVVGKVVGLSDAHAGLDAAAGEEDGEAARVVIASVVSLREGALGVDGASKLATPDNQGVLEEAPLFEVFDEGGRGLIRISALAFDG